MGNGLAIAISFVTLTLLPIAAIGLPLWRFLGLEGWRLSLWILWGLAAATCGSMCFVQGRRIAASKVADDP